MMPGKKTDATFDEMHDVGRRAPPQFQIKNAMAAAPTPKRHPLDKMPKTMGCTVSRTTSSQTTASLLRPPSRLRLISRTNPAVRAHFRDIDDSLSNAGEAHAAALPLPVMPYEGRPRVFYTQDALRLETWVSRR